MEDFEVEAAGARDVGVEGEVEEEEDEDLVEEGSTRTIIISTNSNHHTGGPTVVFLRLSRSMMAHRIKVLPTCRKANRRKERNQMKETCRKVLRNQGSGITEFRFPSLRLVKFLNATFEVEFLSVLLVQTFIAGQMNNCLLSYSKLNISIQKSLRSLQLF